MKKPISLTFDEKFKFMVSLYSVFYRDNKIDKTEGEVLRIFGQVFGMHQNQYKHLANPSLQYIANEINSISDVRARIYFMSIIYEVYRKGLDSWPWPKPDNFPQIYSFLSEKIKLI
ncbi:MAG: hypothetical protein Q8M09_15105 [Pseudomonadota bacterium]|nr:hypothetical protein [Pseudomonadota bacterium]MDP2353324.1 hypothetical protein [Pseudomonadota bacterium]